VKARLPLILILLVLFVTAAAAAGTAFSATRLPGVRSPSGNIKCLFVPGPASPSGKRLPSMLLCTIARADYAKKLVAHCGAPPIQVDWGGFSLGERTKGSIVCTGGVLYDPDTQRPSFVTLPYGKSWRHGVFTCWSRVSGVTCRNRAGHGLFVSREAWRAW
jgi:Family of unknown function (DUF6636)